ncbi:MAG: exodeoxyribonuclease VII large subunit, partial [Candidatus Omnitrophica bacterium]|nr:exodeoxyribonuclease VII large subunit [Candidatus Omnitrophota bacterium]
MPTHISLKKQTGLDPNNLTQRIYTVSELTQDIKLILENSLSSLWLEGEISNFKHHFP